jgi:hypothetical protein
MHIVTNVLNPMVYYKNHLIDTIQEESKSIELKRILNEFSFFIYLHDRFVFSSRLKSGVK